MRISVIGLGYVGLPLSVSLADAGFYVIGVDINKDVVEEINKGRPHIYEPGLEEALVRNLGSKFEATSDTEFAMKNCDAIFITIGTPNYGSNVNMDPLIAAIREIGQFLRKGQIIVMKSTVRVGFTEEVLQPIIEEMSGLKAGHDFYLAFAPERILEGKALKEFCSLPKIVSGINEESIKIVSSILSKMGGQIVTVSSFKVAEMIKLIDNINRDVNIALGNEIGLSCEILNINAFEVIRAANTGYPRNEIMVPGIGVGGSCLTKDTHILAGQLKKRDFSPDLMLQARRINENMPYHTIIIIKNAFYQIKRELKGAKFFILGLAFKGYPETDDIRHSPSEVIISELKKLGAEIVGYDPLVSAEKAKILGIKKVSLDEGFNGADAIIIATNHPSFLRIDLQEATKNMKKHPILIDGWHLFDSAEVVKHGFIHKVIGCG